MKLLRIIASAVILTAIPLGCSVMKKSESESSAKSRDPEMKPMLGIENISPDNFYCVTKRADDRDLKGKIYIGSGKTRSDACTKSLEICGPITGFGDGTGACVTVVSYDNLVTGFGQVEQGLKVEGAIDYGFVCLAKEMPFAGNGFSQRSWPGVGKTMRAAYDSAIALCESRGGANCQAWERCVDLSNASFDSN
jgi:hypothetical protein